MGNRTRGKKSDRIEDFFIVLCEFLLHLSLSNQFFPEPKRWPLVPVVNFFSWVLSFTREHDRLERLDSWRAIINKSLTFCVYFSPRDLFDWWVDRQFTTAIETIWWCLVLKNVEIFFLERNDEEKDYLSKKRTTILVENIYLTRSSPAP